MKTISIMELRKNVYAVTKDLPIEVKAKGKTLFYIVKYLDEQVYTVPEVKLKEIEKELSTVEEPVLEPGTVFDFCKGHWESVKGKKYILRKITYEDENSNPIVNKQWLCPKCISKWKERGVGRVYYL